MRIGVDAMGGDRGVSVVVAGAVAAQSQLEPTDRIVLFGDSAAINAELAKSGDVSRIEVVHTSQIVAMDDSPVESVRSMKDSSLVVMTVQHRQGEIDACISAGNTGACVAAAQMYMKRLKGVSRPGIMIVAPTFKGIFALCDVGANVNCRPQNLVQYAIMCAEYLRYTFNIENPRVGLISVGEEDAKGNDLVKQTNEMLRANKSINFIGNVEGRDILRGVADVMVCDGFVGNVVLKVIEGMAENIVKGMLKKFEEVMPDQLGRVLQVVGKMAEDFDSNNYGGAPLLGMDGIWLICHGASNSKGIMNAILKAKSYGSQDVNRHILETLADDVEVAV